MYASLLYIWLTAIYNAKRLKLQERSALTLSGYIGVVVAMILLFIIFTIVFYTVRENPVAPCRTGLIRNAVLILVSTNSGFALTRRVRITTITR
jgi:hypothetical protein